MFTYQTFEDPNTFDIKSIVSNKFSNKLSKTVRQAEKLVSSCSFYSDTKE